MIGVSPAMAPGTDRQPGMTLADLMKNNPSLQQQQAPALASYLQAPLTNERLQKPIMPDPSAGYVEMDRLPGVKPKALGAFAKGGKGWDIMGIIGDAMLAASGRPGIYLPYKQDMEERVRQEKTRLAEMQERARIDASKPDYFTVGRNRVRFDPTTSQTQTIYEAPADFEEYAGVLGLQPGTDEYNEAVQDYVLRANGPTAQEGREGLEGLRQDNRISLEGVRQDNRTTLRQMPTYANLHPRPTSGRSGGNAAPRNTGSVYAPILAKIAAGQQLSAGERQVIGMYGRGGRAGRGSGAAPSQASGPIATDGKGNKVQWNGKAWAPVR